MFLPDERRYDITCEPHVMIHAKRVLVRINKGEHGTVTLSDSAENARDLMWFLDRYPMEMDGQVRERLVSRVREYQLRLETLDRILAEDYLPRAFEMALPPRQYQAVAAELVLNSGIGLLLADDVGIGKTASAICVLTDPRTRPALVVTLTHLPTQWQREIEKFTPGMRTHILRGVTPYTLDPFPDVVITSYSKLSGWADVLAPYFKTVIFDEGQELRTGNGFKYSAARRFSDLAEYRMALTATPVYNYGDEIFNVVDAIAPGVLGTRHEFGREWCGGIFEKRASIVDPKSFGRYLREQSLMLRRTRADVGRELPPVTRIPHHIEADLSELEKIKTTASELARVILAEAAGARGEKFRAAEELSYKLRLATGLAKASHVAAFTRMLIETGERVVLYGWHHAVYELWREQLHDLKPVFYTGVESVAQKDEARRRFVAGESPLLIMSLRAGAGLDGLQGHCRTVVFGEIDWSPGVHHQCIGRIHRDGQAEPVMAYFLLTDVGSDPVIADVLGVKRRQSEGISDPDANLIEQLDTGEHHVRRLAEAYLEQVRPAASARKPQMTLIEDPH